MLALHSSLRILRSVRIASCSSAQARRNSPQVTPPPHMSHRPFTFKKKVVNHRKQILHPHHSPWRERGPEEEVDPYEEVSHPKGAAKFSFLLTADLCPVSRPFPRRFFFHRKSPIPWTSNNNYEGGTRGRSSRPPTEELRSCETTVLTSPVTCPSEDMNQRQFSPKDDSVKKPHKRHPSAREAEKRRAKRKERGSMEWEHKRTFLHLSPYVRDQKKELFNSKFRTAKGQVKHR